MLDPLFTDETFITFGFGHLVELAEPGHYDEKWQNWKLESLPIFPDRYDFEVAAQTRQIADWLIGMNASPLYTLNLQQKGVQGTFSLGRVQTPTLYLIFQRQEAIENFKKEPFFEVEAK